MTLLDDIMAERMRMILDGRTPGMVFVSPAMLDRLAEALPDAIPPYFLFGMPVGVGITLGPDAFVIEEADAS